MKNNFWIRFILSKLFAIAMFVMGIHLWGAYFAKILPFGMTTESLGIWSMWGSMGWFLAAALITAGIMKFFHEVINNWLRSL